MKVPGVGIDVIETQRFVRFSKAKHHRFLRNNFTKAELDLCFSYKDACPRLAGIFAAKESVVKCLGGKVLIRDIEIRHDRSGQPFAVVAGKRQALALSISHIASLAVAIAIKT